MNTGWRRWAFIILLAGCHAPIAAATATNRSTVDAPRVAQVRGIRPQAMPPLDQISYEAVVASASSRAEDALRAQQDLYWGIATAIGALLFALIAFFGYGQIRSLRETLSEDVIRQLSNSTQFKDAIAAQIEESVLRSVRDAQLAIEQQIDFLNVRNIAERLERQDGFSSAERDSLFDGLMRLKDIRSIVERPEFSAAMNQTFSSFFQAGLWDKIDVLEQELRPLTVADPALVQSLLPSLGYRIFGELQVSGDTYAGFMRYIQAAKDLRYPEIAYAFELAYLVYDQPQGWERRIAIVFEDARSMPPADIIEMIDRVERLSDAAKISRRPRAYHMRIAAKFAAVRDKYAAELTDLRTFADGQAANEPEDAGKPV